MTKQYNRNPYTKLPKACEVCGTVKPMTKAGKFCSNKCRQRNKNNKAKGE